MIDIGYIDINKDLIPYKFDITLDGETYTFEVYYNELKDFFTFNLIKNDKVIALGEKLVYAKPMFLSSMYKDIPSINIIPYDLTEKVERITFENLNEQVFLFIVEGD